MLKGFQQFILKGNVVDLAVGVVIGASFSGVVTALVKDFITPLIGALGGKPDFSSFYFVVNHSKFMVGDFLNAVIAFLINAFVIYFFVVLPMNHLLEQVKKGKSTDPLDKKCDECLSLIPVAAKRCKYCSSPQGRATK